MTLTQDAKDDLLLSHIRQIIREEIRQALADEAEADEQDYTPRLVRIEGKPTMTVQYEHEDVLYAGEVFPVERKL